MQKATKVKVDPAVRAQHEKILPRVWERLARLSEDRYAHPLSSYEDFSGVNQRIMQYANANPRLEALMRLYQLAVTNDGLTDCSVAEKLLTEELKRNPAIDDVECLEVIGALRRDAPKVKQSAVQRTLRRQVDQRYEGRD